jgi:hypothetical protein
VHRVIGSPLRRPPAVEQVTVGSVDLDTDRVAASSGSPASGPTSGPINRRRAGGHSAEQIEFGEELEVVSGPCGACLHEVLVIGVEPGALEDVEHVVYVEFGEALRQHCADEVRMAVEVEVLSGQHAVDIRVTTGAQEVVHPSSVAVDAIVGQGVVSDGNERTQNGRFDHSPSITSIPRTD